MLARLAKVLALANRPGTPAEGDAARAHAERLAARRGLQLVETPRGEILAIDEFRADLLRRLNDIANERDRVVRALNQGGK